MTNSTCVLNVRLRDARPHDYRFGIPKLPFLPLRTSNTMDPEFVRACCAPGHIFTDLEDSCFVQKDV